MQIDTGTDIKTRVLMAVIASITSDYNLYNFRDFLSNRIQLVGSAKHVFS
jgi:hypothetical protein